MSAVVGLYAGFQARWTIQDEVLPAFDPVEYLNKYYNVADELARRPLSGLNPYTYLAAEPAARPPLAVIPAVLLLGKDAEPRSIALVWLAMRLGALIAALCLLAGLSGSAYFVPATMAAILCGLNSAHEMRYFMDPLFDAFGLLLFAALLWDRSLRSWRTSAFVAGVTVMLVLLKPQALAFALPMYCVHGALALRALFGRGGGVGGARPSVSWLLPYAGLAAAGAALAVSPYGRAVREMWDIYSTDMSAKTFAELIVLASFMMPPWLCVFIPSAAAAARKDPPLQAGLAYAAALASWWCFFLGRVISWLPLPRYYAAALPIAAAAIFMAACRGRKSSLAALGVTGVLFCVSMTRAFDGQKASSEVGLIPLAGDIRRAVRGAGLASASVLVLVEDNWMEPMNLSLASRLAAKGEGPRIQFLALPPSDLAASSLGDSSLDIVRALRSGWYLTRSKRKADSEAKWRPLFAFDRLVTDARSPLRPSLKKIFDDPIRPPDAEDTVTLWHLEREPSPETLLAAARFMEPEFHGTGIQEPFRRKIAALERFAAYGTSVEVVDEPTAEAIVRGCRNEWRDVTFDRSFRLLGVGMTRTREGLRMQLVWKSMRGERLRYSVFVHVLDSAGNAVSQADYAQDATRGKAAKGMLWQDTVFIPSAKLKGGEKIGLGLYLGTERMLHADRGPRDWDGRRLLVRLPRSV